MKKSYIIILLLFLEACQHQKSVEKTLFTKTSPTHTQVNFANNLKETDSLNYFTYTSIYMGGGVSAGDINNDGLIDLFFTGNQVSNELYLNKGNLQFENITNAAKLQGDNRWYTGSTLVDINNDGYLDIYCSVAGQSGEKRNQLFINNQDNTFTEAAEEYGIADIGNSVQATFFDYDNDGDLDLYVANYPISHPSTTNMVYDFRMKNVQHEESDHLYRNDGGHFTDVSEEAGVKKYSFSLGIVASDINNDGWQDLYVSNDYSIPDFFYINNKDGSFKEVVKEATSQTSFYGMGIDIADFNNDGFLDIFQVDMESNNNMRQKANMASMNPQLFWETVYYGFHYQYMHNCMQLNSGVINNEVPFFSNISRLTKTSSTDWSWGPLFADFDNDGLKDLFVSNGIRREINNKDFFNKVDSEAYQKYSLLEKTNMIPSEKIENFAFQNKGFLSFEKVNKDWGLDDKSFSNGVVYADLDNDGDLEIITNNIDETATIYQNNNKANNYLKVHFRNAPNNAFGLGSRTYVYTDGKQQVQELTLTRGFQSSVAPELHFGLKDVKTIDSVKTIWQDGSQEVINQVKTNQLLVFDYAKAKSTSLAKKPVKTLFKNDTILTKAFHRENDFDDFATQVLLPHKMSSLGPSVAVADINGDGLDDYFVGGSFGNKASLYVQDNGNFKPIISNAIEKDALYEDVGALFFDADADGDQDLYVVSGGYEFGEQSDFLNDRLYLNDGKGNFQKAENAIPKFKSSGSKVYTFDYNKDGKKDLLVLGRQVPGRYPNPASSFILENNSTKDKVVFTNVTENVAPQFHNLGMATSAIVTDINNDAWEDLIIVGEWMPITLFTNNNGVFTNQSAQYNLTSDTTGWWWSISAGDFDQDGDIDYIVGNNGLNYKYQANEEETFDIFASDFNKDNKSDIILSYYNEGKQYPLRGRQCSSEQIPNVKKRFKDYESFSKATLVDVYGKKNLENSLHYQIKSFASVYLENKGTSFEIHKLPNEAQIAPIHKMVVKDFDADGHLDVVAVGNLYTSEVETPRADAGIGLFLKGNGKGQFQVIQPTETGLFVKGDAKDMQPILVNHQNYILVAKNNDHVQFIKEQQR